MLDQSAEIDRLKRRVLELEELLELNEKPTIKIKLHYPHKRRVSQVLVLLSKREMVSRYSVMLAIGAPEDSESSLCDVYLHNARKQLADWRIRLNVERGRGWFIEPTQRNRLKKILAGEIPPNAGVAA